MKKAVQRAVRSPRPLPDSSAETVDRGAWWAPGATGGWSLAVAVPLALALVCLRSFTDGGYLLQVDSVFGPRPGSVPSGFGAPVAFLQAAGVELFGGELVGRVYAAGALFLAGFGPMVLLRRAPWYARSAAAFLGALNPWVYDRMVDGQWGVVVAAAGLFLWVAAWEALQASPGAYRALMLALTGAAIAAFAPQMLGLVAVLMIVGSLSYRIWRDRTRLLWTGASAAMLGFLLSYAAISFFLSEQAGGYGTVRQFSRADFVFFRSVAGDDYGLLASLAGLYGYWGERMGRFPPANEDASWWPLAAAVIVAAALAGAWFQRHRAWLLICGLLGLTVSASTAFPAGLEGAVWLSDRIPLAGAYREPQKWSALWLLALVTLSAGAVESVAGLLRRRPRSLARAVAPALAYVLILAALLPAGINQIRALPSIVDPLEYPDYWYRTEDYLRSSVPRDEPIIVLPWHLYQPLAASEGRLVANPARAFFSGNLVVPQNLEIPGRFTDVTSRYDRIGAVIEREGYGSCAVARAIREENVNWILVLDGMEAREVTLSLRRCGLSLVQGRPGQTALLRS
jgi:hypothetical protein